MLDYCKVCYRDGFALKADELTKSEFEAILSIFNKAQVGLCVNGVTHDGIVVLP